MFDYIVIGAGSAGCVVANRLSENPANRVLLLEAGPKDSNPMIHMPGGCGEVLKSDKLNWQLWSTPQIHMNNRRLYIPRGKMLGGSSGANGMVYNRGHATDYDDWAAAGNTGWSYDDVLPYFKKSEDQVNGANKFHGTGGELHVRNAPSDNPLYDFFIEAGKEIGIPYNADFNGATQHGIGRYQCTIKNGKRQSSAVAFLHPVLKRPNLSVVTGAEVSKLLVAGEKVSGVEYSKGKGFESVSASQEIILCAGAVKNPQLLQLSGIGHPDDLASVGIKTHHELPGVGRNLQDHLDLLLHYECTEPVTLNGTARFDKQILVGLQYLLFKSGIGACNNIEGAGYVYSNRNETRPDIQLHFVPAYMTGLTDPLPRQHGVTLHACNLRPKARGSVTLASANPKDAPVIDFNFLDNEHDWKKMIGSFGICQELMAANAWQGAIGKPIGATANTDTEEQIRELIKTNSETVYHPVGSCKMGVDENAVVDPQLRVHGLEGLRIADASIIPSQIGGNTSAPAIMIGEKCADLVLGNTLQVIT